jgi:hypothetical protein
MGFGKPVWYAVILAEVQIKMPKNYWNYLLACLSSTYRYA